MFRITQKSEIKYIFGSQRNKLGNMQKKPTHNQAHLVFADTQSQHKKPKELEFLPTLDRHEELTLTKDKRQ